MLENDHTRAQPRSSPQTGYRRAPQAPFSTLLSCAFSGTKRTSGEAVGCVGAALFAASPYFVMVPDTLKSVSFIEKDIKRFPDTHGWAYAQFAGWADVHVPLLVERKMVPRRSRPRASTCRSPGCVGPSSCVVDEPVEVCPRRVGAIGCQALGFEIEALLDPFDHSFRRPDLSLADGTR